MIVVIAIGTSLRTGRFEAERYRQLDPGSRTWAGRNGHLTTQMMQSLANAEQAKSVLSRSNAVGPGRKTDAVIFHGDADFCGVAGQGDMSMRRVGVLDDIHD